LFQASYENIGAYEPGSQVTDHNAIDLDQAVIERALAKVPVDYAWARQVYTRGGNSRSYSVLTVPPLTRSTESGMPVSATGMDGQPTSGSLYRDAYRGSTQVSIVYDVSDQQANHVRCRVGGLPAWLQRLDGCIDISQPVTIGYSEMTVRVHAPCPAAARRVPENWRCINMKETATVGGNVTGRLVIFGAVVAPFAAHCALTTREGGTVCTFDVICNRVGPVTHAHWDRFRWSNTRTGTDLDSQTCALGQI
jgi:hypothetical protein